MSVVLINPFVVEPAHEIDFVAGWMKTAAVFSAEAGYIDTQLHRSIEPDARFRYINIAHWSSAEAWRTAMDRFPPSEKGQAGIEANPALYKPAPGTSIDAVDSKRNLDSAIRSIEEGLARAYQANDVGFFDRILTDDYTVTDGPGTTSDKAKVLRDHRDARLKVSAFTFDAMDVVSLSSTAAAVTGRYHWDAAYDGHPIAGAFRYLRVYVLDNEHGWRVRVGQVTPIIQK